MKKILMIVATAVGAAFLQKKMKENKAEQNLWHEATATPVSTTPPAGS